MKFLQKLAVRPMLTLAAISFGAFVVVADRMLAGKMLGIPADFSEPDVLIINGLLAAAPLIWLAYRGSTRLLPWFTGIVLTLWLAWRWLLNGVAYQRAHDGSGVPMGFALVMLVSPLIIGLACAWLNEVSRQFHLIRVGGPPNRRPSLLAAALLAPRRANRRCLRALRRF